MCLTHVFNFKYTINLQVVYKKSLYRGYSDIDRVEPHISGLTWRLVRCEDIGYLPGNTSSGRWVMRMANVLAVLTLFLAFTGCQAVGETDISSITSGKGTDQVVNNAVKLPEPERDGEVSLEQSLLGRRSVRSYTKQPLTQAEVSQLLWAAQGITDDAGHRTAPSAGATYPLELYIVAGNVEELGAGIYHYLPAGHELVYISGGDIRSDLYDATLSQSAVKDGAISIVITAIYERTTERYGERGIRYVHIEAGHATQNLCLQATALGLGVVTIGAFEDERVSEVLDLPENENPLYVIPVGRK
jgi:SagB-type dehydrogenase family enzyme